MTGLRTAPSNVCIPSDSTSETEVLTENQLSRTHLHLPGPAFISQSRTTGAMRRSSPSSSVSSLSLRTNTSEPSTAPRTSGVKKKTQYIAADTADETFRKRHFDERLGWHEQMLPREEVRDNLINRLTRAVSLASNRSHTAPVDEPDTFRVKPLRQLRTDSQTGSR